MTLNLGNQKGFSLLEVLVAFAILSLALSLIYEIFIATSQRREADLKKYQALTFAEEKLSEALSQRPIQFGKFNGETEHQMGWSLSIERREADEPEHRFETIGYQLQVYPLRTPEVHLISLETRRIRGIGRE